MTKEAIHLTRMRLKCDSCDHSETVEALSASLIDKPCPRCGANLLTKADYDAAVKFESLVKTVNNVAAWLGLGADYATEHDKFSKRVVRVNPRDKGTKIEF